MGMQMAFLGASGNASITAVAQQVARINLGTAEAAIAFFANGQQANIRNGSVSVIGNWVTPTTSADQWEVRATLVSGDTPIGSLNTWQALNIDRSWTVSANANEIKESFLTFEFRKIGDVTVDTTITDSSIYAEGLDIFS